MSKDILGILILLLIGLLVWDGASNIHKNRSETLPPGLSSYLEPVNPSLDIKTLELLSLDRASQER